MEFCYNFDISYLNTPRDCNRKSHQSNKLFYICNIIVHNSILETHEQEIEADMTQASAPHDNHKAPSKTNKLGKGGAAARLRQDLVDQIRQGVLGPNDAVMPAHTLATLYGVSYPTVHRALSELVKSGLIYRVQGRGTFVAAPKTHHDIVGVMMRYEGDLFGTMFSRLSHHLQAEGLVCMGSDAMPNDVDRIPAERLRDVLKFQPDALIVEGIGHFPFEALKAQESAIRHLVFIHLLETDLQFNADAVLSDFQRGGYLAARHLLERGHRRFAVEIFGPADSDYLPWLSSRSRLQGFLAACREFGVPPEHVHVLDGLDNRKEVRRLGELLHAVHRPTAILASTDYHAHCLLKAIHGAGLRMPGDLSLMGYFNTHWCERLDVPLTSVSIREDVLAQRAVDCICEKRKNPNSPRVQLQIEPVVISRASTGSVPRRVGT